MTDPYHYYTPDPGPTQLLWFCVSYEDGSRRWHKAPRDPEDRREPANLAYIRRCDLAARMGGGSNPDAKIPPDVLKRREARAEGNGAIRFHPELRHEEQYGPVSDSVRLWLLPSFARHIAQRRELQHPDGATPITAVRVYLVEHRILAPGVFRRVDPFAPSTYLPYYLGEYAAAGQPTHADDDMLYWLVPIFYYPARPDMPGWYMPKSHPHDFILYDGLRHHTGTDHSLR